MNAPNLLACGANISHLHRAIFRPSGHLPVRTCRGTSHSFPVLWHFAENNPGVVCGCLLGCLAGLGRVLGGVPVGGPAVPAPMRASAIPRHLLETGPRNGASSTAIFATCLFWATNPRFVLWLKPALGNNDCVACSGLLASGDRGLYLQRATCMMRTP